MRIAVTGASGLLGLTLCHTWRREHAVIGLSRGSGLMLPGVEFRRCELSDPEQMASILHSLNVDLVVHCAAMTDVDACEREPRAANLANCEIPRRIAEWCESTGVRLVHVSTDAVFDGIVGGYDESSVPNPINAYGRSKLDGEVAVSSALPSALIARINLFGWSRTGSRSLAEFFFRRLAAGEATHGFTDIWFSPLVTNDIARFLMLAVDARLIGVRHLASRNGISKFAFGRLVASVFGFDPGLVRPAVSESMTFAAPRPKLLVLNADRLSAEVGHELPSVEEGVQCLHKQSQDGRRTEILGSYSST